jgi:hypothetical protein
MITIRRLHIFAFILGFVQMWHFGDAVGCPTADDKIWNDAYENGADIAQRLHH